jgi:hypothetical protein
MFCGLVEMTAIDACAANIVESRRRVYKGVAELGLRSL